MSPTPPPLTAAPSSSSSSSPAPDAGARSASPVTWADPARAAVFHAWLAGQAPAHGLQLPSLVLASADASFRRYLRIDSAHGSRIIMDAPPDKEDCRPFEHVARLMAQAGLRVPEVLAWDETNGFMLLSDLGTHTLMQVMNRDDPQANFGRYMQAVDALITWQLASKPGVLPNYTEAVLRSELALFPDWYLTRHRGVVVEGEIKRTLDEAFNHIVAQNLSWPSVYVHCDFMPRNLMTPTLPTACGSLPPEGAVSSSHKPAQGVATGGGPATKLSGTQDNRLGVLDFQDALYGPITYDIATLMRDAFLTWDEDFVLDITIRYWEKARKAGLPVGDDFGEFYRGVEWMGLQRHLRVAGIFARLTLRDGKPQYLADAPRFIHYIRSTANRYRELRPLQRMVDQIEGIQEQTGFAYGRM